MPKGRYERPEYQPIISFFNDEDSQIYPAFMTPDIQQLDHDHFPQQTHSKVSSRDQPKTIKSFNQNEFSSYSKKTMKNEYDLMINDWQTEKSAVNKINIQDCSSEQYSVELYQKQLFGEAKARKKQNSQSYPIDVDNQTTASFQLNLKKKIDIQLIKKEIRREQKRQMEDLDKQKQHLKQLIQLEPKRSSKKKQQQKKIISKKTLEILAKKFDQFYAYEHNFDYNGPKISLRDLGSLFDIGSNTIIRLYNEWLESPTFYRKIIHYDIQKNDPQKKLNLQRLEHMARLIKENPFMTQSQLSVELNKIEDLKVIKNGKRQQISVQAVRRLLNIGKFRKKRVHCVPKQKNTSKSLEKRFAFCVKYNQLLKKQAKIYFLDQSGFHLYMTRQKAWARPNQQITVNCPINKGKRFSLIAMIGIDGLANWRIIEGTYRKYEYLQFLRQIFEKLYEQGQDKQKPQNWLIMDNCAIHDKEETFKFAQKWNINVLYLPAYSPQLNPIEMWFHQVKTKLRKVNYSGEKQLVEIMGRILQEYETADFSNYYHGTLKFVQKGLRRQKF